MRNWVIALLASFVSLGSPFANSSLAQSSLSTSVNPARSVNGEPIQFKIRIQHVGAERIDPPQLPVLTDWDVLNSFQSISPRSVLRNGNITVQTQGEFVYVLRPRRSGSLQIPALRVRIGNRDLVSEAVDVIVDKVPTQARPSRPPTTTPLPGLFPDSKPEPGRVDVPDRESVFVRAVPSKTRAWVGELIEVAYFLFQDGRTSVTNLDVAKYPDFKGFLKEDLNIPRRLQSMPFELEGRSFNRTELITYGLFPLRTGELRVEPMRVRLETLLSPADLLNSIMMGQAPNVNPGVPMDKSSQELRFDVRALPTAPPEAQFTNGVGQMEMELKVDSQKLAVDQPFSVLLTIGGSGNFPLIEAPELRVPAGIERFDTKSSHQIRQDGTGFKTFEYLLLPRSGGTLTIPSLAWSYFDPQTESYKILKSPELVLSIEGEARVAQTPKSPEAPSYKIFVGPQDFHPTNQSSSPWRYLLLAQGLVFVGLFVAYRYDKKLQAQAALHRAQPWLVTEAEIRKLNPRDFKRRASLCDRWMRERIAGLLKLQVDSETPRAEVLGLLRNATPGELERIESLRALWEELDWVRFSGSQETPNQDSDWLLRCQKIAVAMDRSLPTKTSSE